MASRFDPQNLANVYLFFGEEAYKRRNYKEKLKSLIAGPGSINYAAFEGKNINFSAVYDNAVTLPFFSDKRLIIVENSGKFKARKKKTDEEGPANDTDVSSNESDSPDALLEKLLEDLPPTTCLAFFEPEIAKTKKVYKLIEKKGCVIECSPDKDDVVIKWLAKGFAASHKKIRQSTAQLIIDRVGCDYDMLRQEFEKIIAYAGDNEEITDDDVLAVTSEDIEAKIFEMLDAMCNRNVRKVLDYYYGLLTNKSAPLYILAMIRTQFRTMLQVIEQKNRGAGISDIMSYTKKRDFVVRKCIGFARYFSQERIECILERISETDYSIKCGDLDEQNGVEIMLIEFSS